MILRVTLDTNVLVAGVRSRRGASYQVLRSWVRGEFVACASVPLWVEYEAVLKRPEAAAAHGLTGAEIDVLLDTWAPHVDPVELHYTWRPQLRDPKDEMVFETAMNGRAHALVTFDQGDFAKAAQRFRLALWFPRDLVLRLRSEP
jgi:putative PIN family toxin of toxin-antitoxin system